MSNYNNSFSKSRGGRNYQNKGDRKGGGGGGKERHNWHSGYGKNRNNNNGGRSNKRFPKFADNDYKNHNNDDNYWANDCQNSNNYNSLDRYWGDNDDRTGITAWRRDTPIRPLIIPPQFSDGNGREADEINHNKGASLKVQNVEPQNGENLLSEIRLRSITENSSSVTGKSEMSANNNKAVSEAIPKSQPEVNSRKIQIKQEKPDTNKSKQNKKSSSSSSSSSSESSSEEEVLQNPVKMPVIKAEAKEAPKSVVEKKKETAASSSSSSSTTSSSEEEEEPPKPPPPTPKATQSKFENQGSKTNSSKKKQSSEDDVVCMGNLENKVVLEDDSDQEENEEEQEDIQEELTETSAAATQQLKKKADICMICDKKGHTSFQCQMICKNCSAPYHGYRTCPHPANLNTMLQLFLEFCMQQLQQFTPAKDLNINSSNIVPVPQVDSSITPHAANKRNMNKRKQSKTPDTNTKAKLAKKRKISGNTKKKNLKESNDELEDNDSDSSSESEEDTESESEDFSYSKKSSSSKKKLKQKNKATSGKIPFNMPNFTPNPLNNLPLVLNGIQNLTAGAAAAANPNTSNNALNTLLLTQMFQNAIGSLK